MTKTQQPQPTTAKHTNHFEEDRFKSRLEAHQFLVNSGFKKSNSQFYRDCENGLLPIARDGSLSRHDVLDYARNFKTEHLAKYPRCPLLDKGIRNEARKQERRLKKIQEHLTRFFEAAQPEITAAIEADSGIEEKIKEIRLLFKEILEQAFP